MPTDAPIAITTAAMRPAKSAQRGTSIEIPGRRVANGVVAGGNGVPVLGLREKQSPLMRMRTSWYRFRSSCAELGGGTSRGSEACGCHSQGTRRLSAARLCRPKAPRTASVAPACAPARRDALQTLHTTRGTTINVDSAAVTSDTRSASIALCQPRGARSQVTHPWTEDPSRNYDASGAHIETTPAEPLSSRPPRH